VKGLIRKIQSVTSLLEEAYQSPRLGNKVNPLNELLYIQLSLRTTGPSFERTYTHFKKCFPKWEDVYQASEAEVAGSMFNAGLSMQKASNLKKILQVLIDDFGKLSLSSLKKLSDEELENYLCSLPGIGKKSARCIMMYSFDRAVFPVDSHCFRIIKRLGWIGKKEKYTDKVADKIQGFIPKSVRYSLHVNMVAHGRSMCHPVYPRCSVCPILQLCPFGQERTRNMG